MKLSKKEELVALGSAMYLVGIEVEGNREKLKEMAYQYGGDDEILPVTQELMDTIYAFKNAKREFDRLEKRYLELMQEL